MQLPRRRKPKLSQALDQAVDMLLTLDPATGEWSVHLKDVEKIAKLENDHSPKPVDPNVVMQVAANLLGIAMIIRHESLNVITSKALSFVKKV